MTESDHDAKPKATLESRLPVPSGPWANAWCLPQETSTDPEVEDRTTFEGSEESGRSPGEAPDAPDVAHCCVSSLCCLAGPVSVGMGRSCQSYCTLAETTTFGAINGDNEWTL